jgi:phage repressor protein C with HTH and peptisase S24 domain
LKDLAEIARLLKATRQASGKNQAEFAKIVGVSQRTWSAYESGATKPKLAVLIALQAKGYDVEKIIENSELEAIETEPPDVTNNFANASKEHWERIRKVAGGHPVPLYSQDDFSDGSGFEVPLLQQNLSAGSGAHLPEQDEADAYIRVPARLKRYGKNLAALSVEGDSMYPTLDRGDLVVCDSCGWSGEGVYALRIDGEGFVKRITKAPGKIVIISDNPKYPTREEPENSEGFEIIGRVHCAIKNLE